MKHIGSQRRLAPRSARRALLLALAIGSSVAAAPFRSPADEADVRAAVTTFETGWNLHDMDTMFRAFAPDAEFVNIVGMHWRGLPDIKRAHQLMHESYFRATDNKIESIDARSVAPEAAVAVVTWKKGAFTPPDGVTRPPSRDVMTLFLVKREGRWQIVGAHNTPLDEGAQRFDPIRRK